MSRMLSKMNLISVVQQLPNEDIETIQGYVEMIEQENDVQKVMIENFVKENQELKAINEQHRKINGKLREENQKLETEKEQLNSLVNSCQEEIRRLKKQLEEYIKQNMKLKDELFDKRKEYQDTYKDVRIEIKEYKNQQKEFINYLEDEKDRLARECSQIYEDSLGHTRLVSEDIFDEVNDILQKYKKIIGDNK